MAHGTGHLRKFLISELRLLLRSDILYFSSPSLFLVTNVRTQPPPSAPFTSMYCKWVIGLVAAQIGNREREIALASLSLLEEACQTPECLAMLIGAGMEACACVCVCVCARAVCALVHQPA